MTVNRRTQALVLHGFEPPREHFIGMHTDTTREAVSRNIIIVPDTFLLGDSSFYNQEKRPNKKKKIN